MKSAKTIQKLVMNHLDEVKSDFEANPFNFLTESDIKCHLYMKLARDSHFSKLGKTEDGQWISPLHTEVRYFNDRGNLLFQVDISAINPKYTNVYSQRVKEKRKRPMLAKRYEFDKSHFSIELKLNKGAWSKKLSLKVWEEDLKKLEDLKSRNPSMLCFSILFDKRGHFGKQDLQDLRGSYPNIAIIYSGTKS